jgi:NAD(P)-dependent dehydrogenase (short-subunit alcohol dehydrogenase family)
MISATLQEFGRVDILVNNVGDTIRKLFMEATEEEWYWVLNVNLVQVFRCTRAITKVMMDQEIQGSIINVTTIEAYRAAPGHAIYAAAKAGLANFTKTMALELSPWGIRVNSIAPDTTITAGKVRRWRKHGQDLLGQAKYSHSHIPLNRPGTPEDSGGAAIFLASDLSRWITGEVIHVGGGTLAASGWVRTESGHWSTGGPPQAYSGKPLKPTP